MALLHRSVEGVAVCIGAGLGCCGGHDTVLCIACWLVPCNTVLSLSWVAHIQDPKKAILSLLAAHDYEAAFGRALGLADIPTLMWLCRKVDSAAVTGDPSPLSQVKLRQWCSVCYVAVLMYTQGPAVHRLHCVLQVLVYTNPQKVHIACTDDHPVAGQVAIVLLATVLPTLSIPLRSTGGAVVPAAAAGR